MKRAGSPTTAGRAHAPRGMGNAAALMIAAGLASPASAQWQWTGLVNDQWSVPLNWSLPVAPTEAANVFIGVHPGTGNSTVHLNVSETIAALTIVNGMTLDTGHSSLRVNGDIEISGHNSVPFDDGTGSFLYQSRLKLGSVDGLSLGADNLTLNDLAQLRLQNAIAHFDGQLVNNDSSIYGDGYLTFHGGGSTLVNNGLIQVGSGMGIRMTQTGAGRYDLDGTSGDGHLHMGQYDPDAGQGSTVRMDGVGLSDSFSGQITMGYDADLDMNLTEGWTADANSTFWVAGFPEYEHGPAVIRGGEFSFAGDLKLTGGEGAAMRIESSTFNLLPEARVGLRAGTAADFGLDAGTSVEVEGGSFEVREGAELRFNGDTTVRGGSFVTDDASGAGGTVSFNGPTSWQGAASFDGFVRQNGDAESGGGLGAVINAGRFDMDGAGDATHWTIASPLTVNAGQLQSDGSDTLGGSITIGGGFTSELRVNVKDGAWSSDADINLTGLNPFFVTRLSGSALDYSGAMRLPSGKAQIESDIAFLGGSGVDIASADAALRMRGLTTVHAGVEFSGFGTLVNGDDGLMRLLGGAALNDVGLRNEGLLALGGDDASPDSAGVASVDRFESSDSAIWAVTLGGYDAGTERDLLLVPGGGATLAGLLTVDLVDLGAGLFLPQVGDEFTILASVGGVSGTFIDDPVSQVGSATYHWSVIYNPHTVALRLESVVPTPGSVALIGLCGLVVSIRRRA